MLVAALFPQSYALGLPASSNSLATPRRAGRALLCAAPGGDDILRSLHTTADAAEEQQRRLHRAALAAPASSSSSDGDSPEVHLVGVGPGDVELLTVKALRLMQAADLVLYDRLISPEILSLVSPSAAMLYVGKESGLHTRPQEQIHELLLQFAQSGRTVVRLKGGDPTVFGRGGEEMEYLEAQGVRVRIVPGVTAAAGIAADLGVPLTHRDFADAVHFLTGHAKSGCTTPLGERYEWAKLADPRATLVVYMGLATLPELAPALIAAGLPADTPAMAVQDGTTASQRVVAAGVGDLADAVADAELKSPTLIFVGSVVSLLNKRDDAAAFGDALTEIKTRAAPVRVLTADGAQALLASVGAREGAADERDSRVEVM